MSATPKNSLVLLTTGEVARHFRVERRTATRWAADGLLGAVRTPTGGQWRFSAAAVYEVVPAGVELFTVAEVARLYRVEHTTVGAWARAGVVAAVRLPAGHWRFLAMPIRDSLARPGQAGAVQKTGEPRPIGAVVAQDPDPNPSERKRVR